APLPRLPPAATRPAAPPAPPPARAATRPHPPPGHARPQASSHVPPPRTRARQGGYPAQGAAASTRTAPAHKRGAHGGGGSGPLGNRALPAVAAAALTVLIGLGTWGRSNSRGDGGREEGNAAHREQPTLLP